MLIALFITLDHCRRMHTSSSAECVAAKDGIVVRDSPTTDFRSCGVNYAQAPILMSVPIQSNIAPLFFNDTFHESYNCARAIGCRVAHSVAYTNGLCATANGRGVKGANDIRVCSRSVFGHVHD